MAEMLESSPKTPIQSVNNVSGVQSVNNVAVHETPPLNQPNILGSPNSPTINSGKTGTPDRLKVPKAFKYPERYTSPTDLIMSPITKGLLARSRKVNILPPSKTPPKIQSSQLQEMGVSQN